MRCINEKKVVGTGTPTCIFDCPVSKVHNFEIKAIGACYLGDVDITTDRGLPLSAGASRGYSHTDFKKTTGNIRIYAVADVATSINVFGFIEE